MSEYFFTYDGICSLDFGIKIKGDNALSSPERNFEEIEVPGRNGSVFIDGGNYKNKVIDIECNVDMRDEDIYSLASRMTKWLKEDMAYKELILSDDSDYYYEAVCINKIDFIEMLKGYYSLLISFSCKPLKKRKSESVTCTPVGAIEIYNDGEEAEPIIKVTCVDYDVNVSVYINENIYNFKNVNGEFCINSEMMNVYKIGELKDENYNHKMENINFPVLKSGLNIISCHNCKKIEINPNFKYL